MEWNDLTTTERNSQKKRFNLLGKMGGKVDPEVIEQINAELDDLEQYVEAIEEWVTFTAVVGFRAEYPDVEVTFDSTEPVEPEEDGKCYFPGTHIGKHLLTVSATGYKTYSQELTFDLEHTSLTITLEAE